MKPILLSMQNLVETWRDASLFCRLNRNEVKLGEAKPTVNKMLSQAEHFAVVKKVVVIIFLFLGQLFCNTLLFAQNGVTVEEKDGWLYFGNRKVLMGFDLGKGFFYLKNEKDEKVVDNAYFRCNALHSIDNCRERTWQVENCTDALGTGKTVTIAVKFNDYADILWQATLYDNCEYIVFNMGVDNDTDSPYRLMGFFPLVSEQVYKGKNVRENYRVLDGNGGGSPTWVTDTVKITSFNNMLARFGDVKQPEIIVAGGLTYNEFEKFVRFSTSEKSMQIALYGEDPVGRLIDKGQKYLLNEKFYLCFNNSNPFEALEKYADVLKKSQQIGPGYYHFPTECLWYSAVFNRDPSRGNFNHSKGAVEEMDNAIKSGITRYTKVAIRLVPDDYGHNNQQGWWDDEHWAKYGHYIEPYLTTDSWTKAIIDRGGYPFTYMQSGRRSEDFVKLHPDWMLFNDPYRPIIGEQRITQESSYPNQFRDGYGKTDRAVWTYDFTDPGFTKHMQQVYARLKKAGIKGIFYDYPEITAWAYEGGFENKYATTAWAYRRMFVLAREGLDKDVLLQERNIVRGSDITLGLVASQRVWGDTDIITPEMVSYCGLRWYKNRVVVNYDMDAKSITKALPADHNDGVRTMLTMSYVASGRFLLGNSFPQLSASQLHDMSRTFPYHMKPQSARPIDAFDKGVKYPRVYDFEVNTSWHQLTLYNYNMDAVQTAKNDFIVWLGKSLNEGGLGMDNHRQYYAYDFWNNCLIGIINGNEPFKQTLRPGETRMISLHAKEIFPQFVSTNRHIMQGYIDLKDVRWNSESKTLSGTASVVEGEVYVVVIATNGHKARKVKVDSGKALINMPDKNGFIKLSIESKQNKDIGWIVSF